jgi:hypothetical protein
LVPIPAVHRGGLPPHRDLVNDLTAAAAVAAV